MDVDRISQLPEHIIHCILSFLPTRDLVRVSILSKAWHGFFTCFPISNFCEPECLSGRTLEFANFVYYSLRRQCQQYGSIPKFKLSVTHYWLADPYTKWIEVRGLVNLSLGLCMMHDVQELSLNIHPSVTLGLGDFLFSSNELPRKSIDCPSLREFSVEGLNLCSLTVGSLRFSCPILEEFALINCLLIDFLRLSGFPKLKKVKVINDIKDRIEKIVIDHVPGLQSFSYLGADEGTAADIDLIGCRNLEVLELRNFRVTEKIIQNLDFKFPSLKVLVLQNHGVERIEISSAQLEKLVIDPPVEAVINAPRLQFSNVSSGKQVHMSRTSS